MWRLLVVALASSLSEAGAVEAKDVEERTAAWMDALVQDSRAQAVTDLFCDEGVLVGTTALGIRTLNRSTDGWGSPKAADVTIKSYFDWFATLPQQNITRYQSNIRWVAPSVWVNNVWIQWERVGEPGETVRLTMLFHEQQSGGMCISLLASSQLPDPPNTRRLRGALSDGHESTGYVVDDDDDDDVHDDDRDDDDKSTAAWMHAVVNQSDSQAVADLFCANGMLVATAGFGIRKQTNSTDGWGDEEGHTIKKFFDYFATLPGQRISNRHNNIVRLSTQVYVNNAWVSWTWDGNAGMATRMTFVFVETASGTCIFELALSG